ncbi:HD domain-containing protein [Pseudalkalibacillus berkeleyi]|uniref:HD domain-containing protein n=1 Tax=Pseudalkalibacillus berkeleyi TaxID=1069813 RepID=A0ABS9H0G2_9BACL|nr:HD domain-containing protein [Pseudalkalibacillus berkeleyi]MCF6137328.1 HD domain-containing protein [Pseudalkalibacillus berkeleyi]
MYIEDRLYGTFEVEPVLSDLILSDAVQRLKHVHQNGASYLMNSKWNNTRYDHSIGVMCLIRTLGGTVEEQIAGLLHDVSHTAFSHVVDDALGEVNEDYHEQIKEQMILNSDIPSILKNYQYNLHSVLDESKWMILEQSAPRLCADRIDYTLRDLYGYGEISKLEVEKFLKSMVLYKGRIHLNKQSAAEWFVKQYYREVLDFFLHPLNIYSNHVMAEILKLAIQKSVITKDDFLLTDEQLLSKIQVSTDHEIRTNIKQLSSPVKVIETQDDYDIQVKKKLRLIDPEVLIDNESMHVSELSQDVKDMNAKAKQRSLKGVKIKVITQ